MPVQINNCPFTKKKYYGAMVSADLEYQNRRIVFLINLIKKESAFFLLFLICSLIYILFQLLYSHP